MAEPQLQQLRLPQHRLQQHRLQQTRLQGVQRRLGDSLLRQLRQSWRAGSLSILSLLIGFYLAQNITAMLLVRFRGGRPLLVLALVLLFELIVRLRTRLVSGPAPLPWVMVDNLRIGTTYAMVFEAFKLGT
ncbi:MAG: DUF565 domain-containing protein [Synechococcaceae cyanobacterium ELA263]